MCNFVPGQAIAIGPLAALRQLDNKLPGNLGAPVSLVGEGELRNQDSELARLGYVTLHTDPGLEFMAVSRLSAALSDAVRYGQVVVDVNHILPMAAQTAEPPTLKFSQFAATEVASLRRIFRHHFSSGNLPLRVGILDSGLRDDYRAQREIDYHDYAHAGQRRSGTGKLDPVGHGTRVVSILDQVLPRGIAMSVGRLPSNPSQLTALTVAQALGDMIARDAPDVVNLSVCMQTDGAHCNFCKRTMAVGSFSSSFLPLIIRLGGVSQAATITVMAAGNAGLVPNSRWLTEDVRSLIFAMAENRHGQPARYSSIPSGPRADMFSVAAFGGDDPDERRAQGFFSDGAHGTSYAAPFVSALALLAKLQRPLLDEDEGQFGDQMRNILVQARLEAYRTYRFRR